jgi:ParB/RepB/Spo0J family partition protein
MKRITEFDTFAVPTADILCDDSFNCRGASTAQSVQDLAKSIEENGLQIPVTVQPWEDPPYRLLAGHRRFKAVTVILKWSTIPATIRTDLTEHQARILNLTENLERRDLNMLEEAKALRNLYPEGISLRQAAEEVKRPTRWIQARFRLLDLPEEVQKWAAAGLLSAANIERLCELDDAKEQVRVARSIVRKREEHGKTCHLDFGAHSRKSRAEIAAMIRHLFHCGIDGLPTRLLAWCAGYVSDAEIMAEIANSSQAPS